MGDCGAEGGHASIHEGNTLARQCNGQLTQDGGCGDANSEGGVGQTDVEDDVHQVGGRSQQWGCAGKEREC